MTHNENKKLDDAAAEFVRNFSAPRHITLSGCRSYATYENAEKAARKIADLQTLEGDRRLTYVIVAGTGNEAGRFIPCFVGESAARVIHSGFPVVSV